MAKMIIDAESIRNSGRRQSVAIGMSGGVDSTMAVYFLKEAGFDVIGVNLQLFDDPANPDTLSRDASDAKTMAEKMGCSFARLDLRKEFKESVIKYFIDEYISGRTPNPCVACNPAIKLESLAQFADENGINFIATGHYAQIEYNKDNKRYIIKRAIDLHKDQSYYLNRLKQRHLERMLTPLGKFSKPEIKIRARELGLTVAEKDESQEICFIRDNDYRKFITDNTSPGSIKPGNIVDMNGKIIGIHQGLPFYTIGQRKGLNISHTEPLYVINFNKERNEIIAGERKDTFCKSLTAGSLNWIAFEEPPEKFKCLAQVRYRQKPVEAEVEITGKDLAAVTFIEPITSGSPGQAVVFYDNDLCLGGGWILSI